MKLKKRLLFIFVMFCSSALLNAKCPYYFIDFSISKNFQKLNEECAFVTFEVKNVSEKQISSFTVVFSVCTEDSTNPFDGDNTIIVKIEETIESNESFCFSVNLCDYFETQDIEEDLYIENLFLRTVNFTDGSVWKDFFGSYAISQGL